jgi:hypothetical protein
LVPLQGYLLVFLASVASPISTFCLIRHSLACGSVCKFPFYIKIPIQAAQFLIKRDTRKPTSRNFIIKFLKINQNKGNSKLKEKERMPA